MISVAIITQNSTVSESLRAAISLEPGCQCVGTWNAKEAGLRALAKLSPQVVFVDAEVDDMTALDCIASIKSRLPLAKIISLLVYQDPDLIFQLFQAGASAYVLKRSNPRQIVGAIRETRPVVPAAGQGPAKRNGKSPLAKSPQLGS